MSTSNRTSSTAIIELSESQQALATGLREIARWIEEHPECGEITAVIWQRQPYEETGEQARERLAAFAKALGPDAVEEVRYGSEVQIGRDFHGLRLHAEAKLSVLAGQPEPSYEPILGGRENGR